jgi:thiamine-monophosphate kinase
VRIELDLDAVPLADGVEAATRAAGLDPHRLAATGGDDYELLVTLPADMLAGAVDAVLATGAALTPLGRVLPGEGVVFRDAAGVLREELRGYEHR